ncbi:MAG: type II toxin-antitoxin system VapC family toxin [Oscillibacter sp.]|nr:type II toxin-antitoxin system VapC family toxin [Oscillibacter sp.]MBQ7682448.1 type II toxin-antitoxin system VapC family toxin [Oscillibacter sp.]MBQ9617655.1 type II toxin-antitoxin system VapC family toxin [Oscillibacter sp.]
MSYMLDTNICIYAIKKRPPEVLRRLKDNMEHGLFVSAITLGELRHGVENSASPAKNGRALLQFLTILEVLPFDAAAAMEYGKVRAFLQKQGTPIGPLDTLIAAHAKAEGMTLVTNNVREFERVPGLQIENWVL